MSATGRYFDPWAPEPRPPLPQNFFATRDILLGRCQVLADMALTEDGSFEKGLYPHEEAYICFSAENLPAERATICECKAMRGASDERQLRPHPKENGSSR